MSNNKFSLGQVSRGQMLGLMLLAYLFSFAVRLIWVWQFQDNPNFVWENQLMINTNDGYFFASGAQQALEGLHSPNPRVFGMWDYGVIFFTTLFAKITPFSLETVILYMPSVISSLVVVPMILIARLYKQTLWGFFAALLGSIVWSYYNRTMTGYYDTDMFSAMAPMFILFFLIKNTIDFKFKTALYASIAIAIYPFLYDAGLSIVYAMGIIYAIYMIIQHPKENTTYLSLILIFVSLLPFPFALPFSYGVKIIVLILLYSALKRITIGQRGLVLIAAGFFLLFLIFGNVFGLIFSKISSYIATGTSEEGLHFYSVAQTVREAGKIPFETFANRTSGSVVGVIIALIGYIVLVAKHRAFILALPLIGIGIFSLWGGLRFTVYAVPVAAMSAIYLFWVIAEGFIREKRARYIFVAFLTAGMIYPNIVHIIAYKVPTVLNKAEVEDLVGLDKIASEKDYTLSWWDYGYPIWYYSDTSTLIDGGKHNNDNFIISKILQTSSPELAANLSRLAVETYVDSNYSVVANTLFENKTGEQVDPDLLLSELENGTYEMPPKTRDIYLYLPYKMLNIFPTVAVFGNLDLMTGEAERQILFYSTQIKTNKGASITLQNGIRFDTQKGTINIGSSESNIKYFISTQNRSDNKIKVKSQIYHVDGEYALIYMQSYGKFLVMDLETFNSTYVQMFILGKYDKDLFELVVSSVYSRIYKLKR